MVYGPYLNTLWNMSKHLGSLWTMVSKHWKKIFWMDHFRHTHTHSPLLGTKEIRFKKHFFCNWEKIFWVDHFPHRVSLSSVARNSLFRGLVSSCGAKVINRTHHTIAFLGGGACLPAKRNRKTSPIFSLSLSLSIGGMKEIRLTMPFVFLQLGKSILDGPYTTHTLRIGCTKLKAVPRAGLGFQFLREPIRTIES